MERFVHPDCVGCLFEQLKKVLINFKPDISYGDIITHQKELIRRLVNLPNSDFGSPNLGKIAYSLASEILGVPDPSITIMIKKKRNILRSGRKTKDK